MNNVTIDLNDLFASLTDADIVAGASAMPLFVFPVRAADIPISARCRRCSGLGIIHAFRHVDGGTCFACGGDGIDEGGL